jgi:hypothetical protein
VEALLREFLQKGLLERDSLGGPIGRASARETLEEGIGIYGGFFHECVPPYDILREPMQEVR